MDYKYNASGNLVEVIEHNGTSVYSTSYEYDLSGRLTKVTNNLGNDTAIKYDLVGRKTELIDPNMLDLGGTNDYKWTYEYDANGNVVTQTDARGTVIEIEYDELNRPERRIATKHNGNPVSPAYVLAEWSYDNTSPSTSQRGLLDKSVSYEDLDGDWSWDYKITVDPQGYDKRSRRTATVWTVDDGTASSTYRIDWAFDEANRIESITYPTMGGERENVTYEYDPRTGRPTDLDTDWTTDSVVVDSATWLPSGQPDEWTLGSDPDGKVSRSWLYKSGSQRMWRTNVGTTSGGNDIAGLRYYYDAEGNIERLRDDHNKSNGTTQIQCFTYDDLDRLTEAYTKKALGGCDGDHDNTGMGSYNYIYEYDSIGNLDKIRDRDGLQPALYMWTYGDTSANAGANAPHAWQESGRSSRGYEYDGNGNVVDRNGDTLTWDPENRLARYDGSAANATTDTQFVYDADGVRIVRVGATETITYIGGIFETNGHRETAYYSFGSEVVSLRVNEGTADKRHWLVRDHLGSSVNSIDASDNALVEVQRYYPFGGLRGSASVDTTERLYTGQVSDGGDTGLLFYNARFYDPELRRFIASDPIVPNPANPQAFNRYSYVRNRPTNLVDPTGHDGCGPPPTSDVMAGNIDWWLRSECVDGRTVTPDPGNSIVTVQNADGFDVVEVASGSDIWDWFIDVVVRKITDDTSSITLGSVLVRVTRVASTLKFATDAGFIPLDVRPTSANGRIGQWLSKHPGLKWAATQTTQRVLLGLGVAGALFTTIDGAHHAGVSLAEGNYVGFVQGLAAFGYGVAIVGFFISGSAGAAQTAVVAGVVWLGAEAWEHRDEIAALSSNFDDLVVRYFCCDLSGFYPGRD